MKPPCDRCSKGPDGLTGHEALDLVSPKLLAPFMASRFVLECRECGTRWLRAFGKEGPIWQRA